MIRTRTGIVREPGEYPIGYDGPRHVQSIKVEVEGSPYYITLTETAEGVLVQTCRHAAPGQRVMEREVIKAPLALVERHARRLLEEMGKIKR